MPSRQWLIRLTIFALLRLNLTSALKIVYCSDVNTAGGSGNHSIYQSNGLCYNFCADYAFAVLQGADCWCSNYVPGSTTSTSNCNTPCNGYPDDLCGNDDDGLFGYISVPGNDPSGTKGSNSAASTAAAQETVTADPNTVFIIITSGPSSGSSSSFSATTTTPTLTSTSAPTSDSSSMTWTPTPVTSLETITGQVHTVTVTPTVPPNSQNTTPLTKKKNGGLSTGGAVGLTIGLVALVAIGCIIIYFCWRRRQKERPQETAEDSHQNSSAGLAGPIPVRTMSENSRYVLNTDGRQVVESYEADLPGSRRSRLMPVDPRLNPHAPLYQRGGENKSRESVNTIRDDHDYSRRVHQQGPILRATNPDD